MSGRLLLVGTPLGNLDDVTPRMRAALATADVVLCEDTRHSGRLLKALGIEAKLLPYHDHNEARSTERALDLLRQGRTLALISDAGMPLISDPGYPLVRAALAAGYSIDAVPGPSAPLMALLLSGLPPLPHAVFGFLPVKGRKRAAEAVAAWPHTAILFVSPHRGAAELAALVDACGGARPAALARELTKLHQEVRRDRLDALAASIASDPPKGEWTLVLGPVVSGTRAAPDVATLATEALHYAAKQAIGLKAACQHVADAYGIPWRPLYKAVLAGTAKPEP